MSTTSLLYHGFGIAGYHLVNSEFEGGVLKFRIDNNRIFRCTRCLSRDVIKRGTVTRSFGTTPIGRKPVFIELPIQRVECRTCGTVRQVDVGFADERRSYTKAFERYVLELSKFTTIYDVARHLGVSWDTVKDIQMRNLERRYRHISLKDLKLIAIDEISIGKNHQYLTIVLDLNTGAIVFTNEGKGAEALDPFWKRLRYTKAEIDAVAIDMSPAYAFAVKKNLPNAAIVFDHFHIIKMFNEKLAELRRDIQNEAQTMKQKRVIKGTRWLLLKASENLSHEHRAKLDEALDLNKPLAPAYYMKEDLRQLWSQRDKQSASLFLDDWIARARSSGIRKLMDFSKTLATHRFGILAWYDYPISTGPLEGTNNKIKTLIKTAYGYRDKEFLKLKLYALHEAKFKMVG
jgi:transposase